LSSKVVLGNNFRRSKKSRYTINVNSGNCGCMIMANRKDRSCKAGSWGNKSKSKLKGGVVELLTVYIICREVLWP